MKILVSNDDGYLAPGLSCLVEALKTFGETTVVVPDRNRSGASNSLTLDLPLRTNVSERGYICVNGTPTDCVHLALTGLLDEEPDIVVSGINMGANLGDDVLYSGTVAAAMEGRHLGYPSIAVSMCGSQPVHYDTATDVVCRVIERLKIDALDFNSILNINIPDLPLHELKGIKVTRLGNRHKAEAVICQRDPRGQPIYWVGPAGPAQDAGEGTDFHAVANGYASITPLQVDLTRYSSLDSLSNWVEGLK